MLYINTKSRTAFKEFSENFNGMLLNKLKNQYDSIVILCVGTDRSTGDSFGPLIGYKLQELNFNNVHVYGTLESPVHAKNLDDSLKIIKEKHKKPLIIAIDACLGEMCHVGYITLEDGSIKPGTALDKKLPEVGEIAITGIVNFSGYMDFMVLQNTRLSVVMSMADLIAKGIRYSFWKASCLENILLSSNKQQVSI